MYSILVVDDEALTRKFLQSNITNWAPKWNVTATAMDGFEAWELMQQMRFDLVITDIKMPEVDGLELCKRISSKFPHQKVIILSGYDEFSLAQEAIRYGVGNYLLKPILKEEMIHTLQRMETEREQETTQEMALKALQSVSDVTQKQVVKQFLSAVTTGNHVEIKTMYPLIYRMKVHLIEAEAVILILGLDENLLWDRSIPITDRSVFRFILHQIAEEFAQDADVGNVFSDREQHTCVFVTGENEAEMHSRCQWLYEKVSAALLQHTHLTVSGAIGTSVSDLQQLDGSYRHARQLFTSRLISGTGKLYSSKQALSMEESSEIAIDTRILSIENALTALHTSLFEHNSWGFQTPLRQYVDLIDPLNVPQSLLYGITLVEHLKYANSNVTDEPVDSALAFLNKINFFGSRLALSDVMDVYTEMMQTLMNENERDSTPLDEQDIVTQAKAYICAHYAEPISLASTAERIGISPAYLSSVFSQREQEGYIKFLTRIRMEQAAKLLRQVPRQKIYDIAVKVGYISSKHFSHVFKQHYGIPPGEYQEQ